jgi:hypothetical protein
MNDARSAERGVVRGTSGLILFWLTVVWIGGTIAFFVAAVGESFCLECEISMHDRLLADRLVLGSVTCACVFPLLATVICVSTNRGLGTVIFLILGVSVALAYGTTAGVGAVRDIHHIERSTSVPIPSNDCPCYSGGSCDCPGG